MIELAAQVVQSVAIVSIAICVVLANVSIAMLFRRIGAEVPMIPNFGPEIGEPAPPLVGRDVRDGGRVDLRDFRGQRVLILFVSGDCPPCLELCNALPRFMRQSDAPPVIAVVVSPRGVDLSKVMPANVWLVADKNGRLKARWDARMEPLVCLIDAEGQVANRTAALSFIGLQDTLDGRGRPQGTAEWVAEPTG